MVVEETLWLKQQAKLKKAYEYLEQNKNTMGHNEEASSATDVASSIWNSYIEYE